MNMYGHTQITAPQDGMVLHSLLIFGGWLEVSMQNFPCASLQTEDFADDFFLSYPSLRRCSVFFPIDITAPCIRSPLVRLSYTFCYCGCECECECGFTT